MRLAFAAVLLAAGGVASAAESPFQRARKLEREGKEKEAFLAYLGIPGAEYAAARLARPKAETFLGIVRDALADRAGVFQPRAKLVEGDLLLALGRKREALTCYREVLSKIGKGWDDGFMPPDYYPVEPPKERQAAHPVQPFTLGPGSHRDNWLIRRLIALEAWEDAENEFARIWEIHRVATKPYVGSRPLFKDGKFASERCLVRPAGFSGRGLQFAIDYAYFLKRRGNVKDGLAVLMEPLLLIDMDRNPNTAGAGEAITEREAKKYPGPPRLTALRPHWGLFGGASAGISRKEFIRLAYGEFKTAGSEDVLVAALKKQIAQGRNAARRVLARVRLHQGDLPECLALELAYIERGGFDELGGAYRRGLVHEDCRKLAEAAAEYEKVLALPYRPPRLPDKDEEASQRQMMCQRGPVYLDPGSPAGRAAFQSEVLERLARLYGALAQADKVLGVSLRQYEVNAQLLERFESLEATGRRFRAAGKEREFRDWARERLRKVESPNARANLAWLLGDHAAAAKAVAEQAGKARGGRNPWAFSQWKTRFRQAGKAKLRVLLEALVKVDPDDARSRLELLDLENRWEPEEVIPALETLLGQDASCAFARGKGEYNRTRFRNYYDLAYRLMRLYEKVGDKAKLIALGFRVLEGEAPFARRGDDAILRTPRANWHRRQPVEDVLQCVYVMLPHLRKPEDIAKAAVLADASEWIPLKNHIASLLPDRRGRRIDPCQRHRRRYPKVTVATAGLPAGMRVLTGRDDVRAVSPDGHWIGTSWGLVRYRTHGDGSLEVLQLPLGTRVTAFRETPAGLYVGTHSGLFRIDGPDADKPSPVRIYVEGVLPGRKPGHSAYVEQLLWWQERLWVRDGDHVIQFDPVTKKARYLGRQKGRLFTGAGRLWSGRAVFSGERGEFEPLRCDESYRYLQCIGSTSKEVWANVYVNNKLRHRPALVDTETLRVRPLSISNPPRGEPLLVNGLFDILYEDNEHVWLLGNNNRLTVFDRARGELRLCPPPEYGPTVKHRGPAIWRAPGRAFFRYHLGSGTREDIPRLVLEGDRGPRFVWREYPGHRVLLGAAIIREWREDNLGFDDNVGMSHHVQDLEGGLFEINTETLQWEKLGALSEELSDFYVKRIYFDDRARKAYVCTNGGVTVLSLPDCDPVRRITVSDGLPSNKVEDVVRIGQKLYFACELGDNRGGLAVMDVRSGLIQTLSMADGLESDKVRRLRADGTRLHILYGTVYGPRSRHRLGRRCVAAGRDDRVLTFKSSILDTTTGNIFEGSEVLPAPSPPDEKRQIPFLGGAVLVDVEHGGKRFIGGTHGLVIADEGVRVRLGTIIDTPSENATPVLSLRQKQLEEADRVKIPRVILPGKLEGFLAHDNPYVRANALAAVMRFVGEAGAEYTPVIGKCVTDPSYRVRATAVWLLSRAEDDAAIRPLKTALKDPEPCVRAVAAISLAKKGEVPDLSYFEEIFRNRDRYGGMPFGARSSVGVGARKEQAYRALAPEADRDAFVLFMKYPLTADDYEPRQRILAELGKSLVRHPEAADVLLKAYDPDRWSWGQVRFAQAVFKHAGERMLPILHEALQSKDRVVRSNAARACGAIGDSSSIPRLIRALDLESGLSRASIVWALGELKAKEALGELVKLYIDARNDEERRRGSGFRAAQSAAAIRAHYDSFRNLDAVGADWNELKAAALPKPVDPRANEELLSPEHVLEAVRKIGPAAAQDFYRTLAGEKDARARKEAAEHLVECGPEDRERNLPVLRNLLADNDLSVRMPAAVSLLILGQGLAERPVLEWLDSPNDWEKRAILRQLARVKGPATLSFARARIEACARDQSLHRDTRKAALAIIKGTLNE